MEIKIDTKRDSPDDIRKAIDLLQRIVEVSGGGSNGSSEINPTSDMGAGMANLFSDEPVLGEAPDNPDEDKDEEEEKANIEIVPY